MKNKQTPEKKNNFWILKTFILTFSLAMVFAVISGEVLEKVNAMFAERAAAVAPAEEESKKEENSVIDIEPKEEISLQF